MTTAQLQLPFDLPVQTPPKRNDRWLRKSKRTTSYARRRVEVTEVLTEDHVYAILKLAHEFQHDVDLNEHMDPDIVTTTCINVKNDPNRDYLNMFVAYADNEPVGFLVGSTLPAMHRLGVVAEQKLWYVTENARGTPAAKLLIRAFERWAKLNGATQIFTGTANTRYAERTSQLLEQLGYARVGSLHVMEI